MYRAWIDAAIGLWSYVQHRTDIMSPVMKCTLRDRRSSLETTSAERLPSLAAGPPQALVAAAAHPLPRQSAHPGARTYGKPFAKRKGFDLMSLHRQS
jgi:hypothetical protein